MKNPTILFFLFLCSLVPSYSQSKNISAKKIDYTFTQEVLGGPDMHGYLYRKKYMSEDDYIKYNHWPGYVVSSNDELEALYKKYPNCEAIKFERWKQKETDSIHFALSDVIGKFKNLKYLEISSNRINKYPLSMEQLVLLEELIIQMRDKESIDFSFNNFSNLKHLTIHHADDLKEFPFTIFNIKGLISLKLFRFFQVSERVLVGIDNLTSLKELYIWDSRLLLPKNFKGNENLKTLILDRYREAIPKGVYAITSLERLGLSTVFDTLDLAEMSKLKKLESLSLYYQGHFKNRLELPHLEHLEITYYRGTNLNIGISQLPRLKSLVVWSCNEIESLTDFSAPSLNSITINSNEKLKEIRFQEPQLKNIKEVIMKNNRQLVLNKTLLNNIPIQRSN